MADEESRPGGSATETAHKSNAKDSQQITRRPRRLIDVIGPFRGQHNPLRGGWSVEQLQLVALPMGTTEDAVAMIACSLVAEERTTAVPLRYSRSQKNYTHFLAYQGDPLMTYRRIVPAADWLIDNGYAEGHMGMWDFRKQSIIRATPKLMSTIGHLVDVTERQGAILKDEIVLRDKDGTSIGFSDTDEIRRMRQEMKTINAHLGSQRFIYKGVDMYVPPAARIFNHNFRRGGRLYHQGSSYQQMHKTKRAQIEIVLDDGTVSPMVELDFTSLHMALIYRAAGKRQPEGDLYGIEGFTRRLVKLGCLVSINADGNEVAAIAKALFDDDELALENGIDYRSPSALKLAAGRLVAAIRRKHYRVMEFFGSGAGAELMKIDSDMAVQIMLTMIKKTGRCPMVVHDSFLVPKSDTEELCSVMAAVLHASNASEENNPSPLPIHLGKHSTEQVEHEPPICSRKPLGTVVKTLTINTDHIDSDTGTPMQKWSPEPWEIRRKKVARFLQRAESSCTSEV